MVLTANPLDMTLKRILITGAFSGIGKETARVLEGLEARLILTGRSIIRFGFRNISKF
jgi:short-subunit dehydrogenase